MTDNDLVRRRPGGRTAEHTRSIFDATMAVLVESGLPGVSFQAVADRAGVGRATMYRRWSSIAHLVVEAIRASAEDNIVPKNTGTFRGDLRNLLRQIASFASSPLGRAALSVGLQFDYVPRKAGPNSSWEGRWLQVEPIFERAIGRGDIPINADTEMLFASLAGAVYVRLLVMGQSVTNQWITRTLDLHLT